MKAALADHPVVLVYGTEPILVRRRAKEWFEDWSREFGGMDHEIIDAATTNSAEALKALRRLREAILTLPFFGNAKVVWFQGCSFLGEDRTSSSASVLEMLSEMAAEWTTFSWQGVRLVISAGKVDKRRAFYKALDKLGKVEEFAALDPDKDPDWAVKAETVVEGELRERGKSISEEALASLVSSVGPNLGLLAVEADKIATYVGDRRTVEREDVAAVAVRNKQAKAFALGDALGDRDLLRLLRTLDEELWQMQVDRDRSVIGILYGLVAKVRSMVLMKELVAEGLMRPEENYARFKAQLSRIPSGRLPEDRRYNPASQHPFVLFSALRQSARYTSEELVNAMERLLRCNQQLLSTTGQDDALLLQRALVDIVGPGVTRPKGEEIPPLHPGTGLKV